MKITILFFTLLSITNAFSALRCLWNIYSYATNEYITVSTEGATFYDNYTSVTAQHTDYIQIQAVKCDSN